MPSLIQTNIPLGPRTTLGVGGVAEFYAEISNDAELHEVCDWARVHNHRITILGGGSNILVDDHGVKGLVVKLGLYEIVKFPSTDSCRYIVGAGVLLDEFVAHVVSQDVWGIENLSGIPGTVGAVPIQNVGAYGIEAKDVVSEVCVYDLHSGERHTRTNQECQFSYRDSIFKHEAGARYAILSVTFCLKHDAVPQLGYKDLHEHFKDVRVSSPQEVRNAVLEIRSKKFPDWNVVGTAGSFFKNPIITKQAFETLRNTYPDVPGHRDGDSVKINLGWILDHVCHLRGYCEESICLYEKQALVLVCTKGTSSDSIIHFSDKIIEKVFSATGISVEREVTFLK